MHSILLLPVAASAASLAGAVWARGLELRLLLGELAVLFILFPASFYSMIYYIRWRWWRRNRRGVCGSCGRNPKAEGPGGLCAECMRSAAERINGGTRDGHV
ncbi:MAG TPA: hypothetical protein VGI81_25225 [Tepidisphaeraceae bacterium]|jgi:hypothetical protein